MCTPMFGAESFRSDRMSNQLMSIDAQRKWEKLVMRYFFL